MGRPITEEPKAKVSLQAKISSLVEIKVLSEEAKTSQTYILGSCIELSIPFVEKMVSLSKEIGIPIKDLMPLAFEYSEPMFEKLSKKIESLKNQP